MGRPSFNPDASSALSFFNNSNSALKATVVQAFGPNAAGRYVNCGNLYRLHIENNDSTANFVQFFDLASGSVTVGTTAPTFTLMIPASGIVIIDPNDAPIYFFKNACSIAATTTRTGSTANTNGVNVLLWYKNS